MTDITSTKFYVWFTKNDSDGKWPRISNQEDFDKLSKESIRSATEIEVANIFTQW